MPFLRVIESKHVMWILTMFWAMWLYTEVTEYVSRDKFVVEVTDFMHKGGRFTHEDGDILSARIDQIEARLKAIDIHHAEEAHHGEIQ